MFVLENRSEEVIRLRDVRSDCGCLVADEYSKSIEPGDTAEIKVTISVFGPPGHFRKSLLVREDAGRPQTVAEDLSARITLRLPESLKDNIEAAATASGDSVNAYVVKTLTKRSGRRSARRITETFET